VSRSPEASVNSKGIFSLSRFVRRPISKNPECNEENPLDSGPYESRRVYGLYVVVFLLVTSK
jgi:hypothetical protein